MNGERTDASNIGGLLGPKNGVAQQSCADAFARPLRAHAEARQQHDRNRMPGKPLCLRVRHVTIADLADDVCKPIEKTDRRRVGQRAC